MAAFIIRVVLHDASAEDYAALHDRMRKLVGARRQILSDSGAWFDLPDAEYFVRSKQTRQAVFAAAHRASLSVKPKPWPSVLVTEMKGATFRLRKPPAQS